MRALGGIDDAARVGFSVKANADRLRRFAYLEQRLMVLAARQMHRVPEWELKHALGRLWGAFIESPPGRSNKSTPHPARRGAAGTG